MAINLTYALRKDKLIHISEIGLDERGSLCNCVCINCGNPVLAKMGGSKVNHFSHKGKKCNATASELLKLYVKQYIITHKGLYLPTVVMQHDKNPLFNRQFYLTNKRLKGKEIKTVKRAMKIRFSSVTVDKYFKHLNPDIVLYKEREPLLVYILFGMKLDKEKIDKIKKSNTNALVIDLEDFIEKESLTNKENLEDIIYRSGEYKYWVHHKEYEFVKELMKDETKLKVKSKMYSKK